MRRRTVAQIEESLRARRQGSGGVVLWRSARTRTDADALAAVEILGRVVARHPTDRQAQRRMITRWAGLLETHDPMVSEALLDIRLDAARAA